MKTWFTKTWPCCLVALLLASPGWTQAPPLAKGQLRLPEFAALDVAIRRLRESPVVVGGGPAGGGARAAAGGAGRTGWAGVCPTPPRGPKRPHLACGPPPTPSSCFLCAFTEECLH